VEPKERKVKSERFGLPPFGRHRKKVLNYFVGGVYGSHQKKEVQ
jgi:hypothetical protein